MIQGKNFIGGKFTAEGSQTYHAVSAADNKPLPDKYVRATEREINEAVRHAVRAFDEYKKKTPAQTSQFLNAIADEILALGDELIKIVGAEAGLPEARITSERGRTVNQLKLFAKLVEEGSWVQARIDVAQPDRQPLPKPDLRSMLIPIGPVVVFGASNFPLAYSTMGGDSASALAAGNPVIVKAHPSHPGTSDLTAQAVAKAIKRCEMPDGVFGLIHGQVEEGLHLVRHPDVKAVGFTGSLKAGRAIFDAAAARPEPIPVFAEMGSINPVVILPSALENDTDKIATGLSQSITLGVGQFCTNPGLIVALDDQQTRKFTSKLAEGISAAKPSSMLNKNISAAYDAGTEKLAQTPGVNVAARSSQKGDATKNQPESFLFTVKGSTFIENKNLHEEVFGPASLVVLCKDLDELRAVVSSLGGQLTGTIYGTEADVNKNRDIVERLQTKVGRLLFGGVPTGVEVCDSMNHGGPYPATTDARNTSVGTAAILRFARPICYQNYPQSLLPDSLKNKNILGIQRLVDGARTTASIN